MANGYKESVRSHYSFLELEEVEKYFADLNIDLLKGKHIQRSDYHSFKLLKNFFQEFKHYYEALYGLCLIEDKIDSATYFYLSFPMENKGKLYHPTRHKELTHWHIMVGMALLNMYNEKYFEYPKEVRWEDIQRIITDSENSKSYKLLLFDDIREHYMDNEWDEAFQKFKRALTEFKNLGWINAINLSNPEEMVFEINECIHRLAKLYDYEINNFDDFVKSCQKKY